MLCPLGTTSAIGGEEAPRPKHRPVAMCLLSSRPVLDGLSRVLRSLHQKGVHQVLVRVSVRVRVRVRARVRVRDRRAQGSG